MFILHHAVRERIKIENA